MPLSTPAIGGSRVEKKLKGLIKTFLPSTQMSKSEKPFLMFTLGKKLFYFISRYLRDGARRLASHIYFDVTP